MGLSFRGLTQLNSMYAFRTQTLHHGHCVFPYPAFARDSIWGLAFKQKTKTRQVTSCFFNSIAMGFFNACIQRLAIAQLANAIQTHYSTRT